MLMCVILLWPSKIICSLILIQNMFNVWVVEDKLIQKNFFGRSGLNTSVFEKYFISYSCILFIKYYALRSFCIKLLCFLKIWVFQIFNQSSVIFDQSKNSIFFKSCFCLTRLVFDRCSTNRNWKFLVFKYLTNFFVMHHLFLGFICIALFLYPSYSFVVISLIVFTHSMHTLC